MKIFHALLLLTLVSASCLRAQVYDPDYLDGNIYLKVQDTSSIVPDPVAVPALNNIFTLFGVDTIYKAFSSTHPLLNKIYRLEFSQVSSTGQLLTALQALSFVDYAEQVPLVQTQAAAAYTPNDLATQQWHLNQVNATAAWTLGRGDSNVVVAIVDNAVLTSHEDLNGVLWVNPGEVPNNFLDDDLNGYVDDINGYDVADFDNNPNPPTPSTGWDHGTHCAGIAGAETDNGKGIASIGFGIRIMCVKASLNLTGGNTLERAYEGVDYAVAAGADVINMSWGSSGNSLTAQRVMLMASLNNIVMVAAAGNNNDSVPFYPAAYSQTISVGSTNAADEKSAFSNYGTTVDVMAPGSGIYSSIAASATDYGILSGTSMACPLVAGLAGLILSNAPGLTPAQVKDAIQTGCENIDQFNPSYVGKIGTGRINAYNSLTQVLVSTDPAALPPPVQVYPNPAQGFMVVQTTPASAGSEIVLHDPHGRELLHKTLLEKVERHRIDLTGLAPGLYLLEIRSGASRQTSKLLIR